MIKNLIFSLLLISHLAHAEIVLGPYPMSVRCPIGTEQLIGRTHYCRFKDPNIVQAGYGRCPAGLKNSTTTTVGRSIWCVVKR